LSLSISKESITEDSSFFATGFFFLAMGFEEYSQRRDFGCGLFIFSLPFLDGGGRFPTLPPEEVCSLVVHGGVDLQSNDVSSFLSCRFNELNASLLPPLSVSPLSKRSLRSWACDYRLYGEFELQ
jgi:hypothetical protein